jgi:hypothetical protein
MANETVKGRMQFGYGYFLRNFDGACISKDKRKIRFVNKFSSNGRSSNMSFGYFELDSDGIITQCERGYTKDYKGAKVIELDKFPPMMMFGREC